MNPVAKIVLFFLFFISCTAQSQTIYSIIVEDNLGNRIENATVLINNKQKNTDKTGIAKFEISNEGEYLIQIISDDYKIYSKVIHLKSDTNLIFTLEKEDTLLDPIVIKNESQSSKVNRAIIRSIVVDTKSEILRPTSLNELMNKTTGIRIRQGGGLGSQTNINLNGFQGTAIRFFKDGIPLNFLGEGYNLSNIPLDVLDRVEVYKGIIPVHLASDALGGAVNLITSNSKANTLRASFEYGSFNTIRNAVRIHHNINDNLYVGAEAFFNYSDNDYKINTPDSEIAKKYSKVKLFHNHYKHLYSNAYVGATNLSWGDLIRFDLIYYNLKKEIQNSPNSMIVPYGAIEDRQYSVIPTLNYKKIFFDDKFSVDQFLSYNVVKTRAIDTLQGNYNWLAERLPRTYKGEGAFPMDADIGMTFITSRSLLGYQLNKNHQIWVNNTYNYIKRVGTDPYGRKIEDTQQVIIELPTKYTKNTLAFGITSEWFNKKIETNFIAKSFHYYSKGLNTANNVDLRSNDIHSFTENAFGWALGFKYRLNAKTSLRFSIEDSRRLPGYSELFGDYIFIASNFNLKPEKSLNINLGIDKEQGLFRYGFNSFYRNTKDIIVLVSGTPPLSVFVNKEKANGYGFEGDLKMNFYKQYNAYINFTLQNIRYGNFGHIADKWLEGNRVPNIPFFFANLGLEGDFNAIFYKYDGLTTYANLNFVREFYIQAIAKSNEPKGFLGLFGNSKGDVKNIVPDQTMLTVGTLYNLKDKGISIGLEIRNLLNQDLYDYFKIQKAGRSLYAKLNYKLN